ncbi:hypothetical protein K2173_026093 [Erythroxylum novogranatense]|uniref:NAB domain-containing protein n=1 Tax=Erythroxylum novogranatense TaxID=1862640 RepID=A0AAV8TZG0_9ROSI|nr:hypothetical protein K2173_026093 [Erythroxylum novogranatense]
MLQRAASNAYSWWWASHIRTKQSKWLEQNLHDMEEKVHYTLKLIEEDGDSFSKRAEMYYKKRPELINFVEESYRAYRALAERYDHISTELQNANNTIAYVFPEQVQLSMEEEDDEPPPKASKKPPEVSKGNIPKVPKIPKDLQGAITSAAKKLQPKRSMKGASPSLPVFKSGLSKPEGLERIDKLQKEILSLQTEKEFVKSSYESGIAKYWEIEEEIRQVQEKVCLLQDEFGAGIVIEDDEARTLMASAALKSCEETLTQLRERQEKSAEEAVAEAERIKNAQEQMKSLRDVFLNGENIDHEKPQAKDDSVEVAEELKKSSDQETSVSTQATQEEKIKEQSDGLNSPLTVIDMAEKIDELVEKVISLESAISSQTAHIQTLRTETDELQSQIRTLENDKTTLVNGKNELSINVREMKEKLNGLQDLNQSLQEQNNSLQAQLTEARCTHDHLPNKNVKQDEGLDVTKQMENGSLVEFESQEVSKQQDSLPQLESQEESEGQERFKGEEGSSIKIESQEDNKEQKQAFASNSNSEEPGKVKPETKTQISGSLVQLEHQSEAKGLDLPVEHVSQELLKTSEGSLANFGSQEAFKMQEAETAFGDKEEQENVKPEKELKISDNKFDEQEVDLPDEKSLKETQSRHSDSVQKENCTAEVDLLGESTKPVQSSTEMEDTQEQIKRKDDEPDWKELFMNGIENREKALLTEYTNLLRNYKEAKKKLVEAEQKNEDSRFDSTLQLRELKTANAKKDEQIEYLRQKLSLLQAGIGEPYESENSTETEPIAEEKDAIEAMLMNLPEGPSEIERRFRSRIDEVLEENLDFWLRFSATFHQIQKFDTEVKDLQAELSKLDDKRKKQEGSSAGRYSIKSDAKPIYKHLGEINAELTVWLEKSGQLKNELNSRFSSLCDIQEEITSALKESAEVGDFKFKTHQAAKFQGEVLNMKQENNKVADELQAGLDHITALQLDVDKTLTKVNEELKLSAPRGNRPTQLQHADSRSRVPLQSFIFGPKKQKHSLFSRMQPVLQKKYNGFKSGPI